jgi:nucleoid-associated protein YgaU
MIFVLLLVSSVTVFGQDERQIKMDEYKAELAGYQMREADANTKIASLEAENADLKQQIEDTQGQIDAEWDEIYAMLGTDKAGVDAFRADLDAMDSELDGLAALSPEELFRNKGELKGVWKRIKEAKGNNIATLTEMEEKIAALEGKVAGLKAKMPANVYDHYTVADGDYLWKISKSEDIYGDPYQWIRIYCVNKDQIKDPDLIYPEQIFKIARGVGENEHLVVKGDYLFKIAGLAKVFNDPAKWTQLYEANKDIVTDPNLIYPHQVLTIPSE